MVSIGLLDSEDSSGLGRSNKSTIPLSVNSPSFVSSVSRQNRAYLRNGPLDSWVKFESPGYRSLVNVRLVNFIMADDYGIRKVSGVLHSPLPIADNIEKLGA